MSTARSRVVLLDSSFLIAYYNTRDAHHAQAARAMAQLFAGTWGQALLLEYVFLEVVTVLLARGNLESAVRVGDTLLAASELTFVPCSELFLAGLHVFRNQLRGHLSFADATIVAAASRHDDPHVLTFDADFRDIEGLTVVPS